MDLRRLEISNSTLKYFLNRLITWLARLSLIIVSIINLCNAQNSSPDDLWIEYSQAKDRGDYKLALKPISVLAEMYRQVSNDVTRDTLVAMFIGFQADVYENLGRIDKAESLYKEELEIYKNAFDDTSFNVVYGLKQLIRLYWSIEQDSLAIPYQEQLIASLNKRKNIDYVSLAEVYYNIAFSYRDINALDKAETSYITALDIYKTKLNPEKYHEEIASILYNLGSIYSSQFAFSKAIPLQIDALKFAEKTYGVKSKRAAIAHNNLALSYSRTFQISSAKQHYLIALKICEDLYGMNDTNCIVPISQLSLFFNEIGEYKEALSYALRAQEIRIKWYGESSAEVADGMIATASIKSHMGETNEAIKLTVNAIEKYRILGMILTTEYSTALNNQARNYESLGDFQTALTYQINSLQIDKEVLGQYHPRVAMGYNGLGSIYSNLGMIDSSFHYHLKGLEIKELFYKNDTLMYIIELNNVALLFSETGRFSTADSIYRSILNYYIKAFGYNHIQTAIAFNNIASNYEKLSDFKNAIEYYKKSEAILFDLPMINKPELALVKNNLGKLYASIGNFSLATNYYEEALNSYKSIYSENHFYVAMCYNNIAMVYNQSKDYNKALACMQRSLNIYNSIISNQHPNVAICLNNLGIIYSNMGDYGMAIECYKKSLALTEKIFGSDHLETALKLNNLGEMYRISGQKGYSVDYHNKALKIYKSFYCNNSGNICNDNPDYIRSLNNTAAILFETGDFTRSLDLFKELFDNLNSGLYDNLLWLYGDFKKNFWDIKRDYYLNLFAYSLAGNLFYQKVTDLPYNSTLLTKGFLLEESRSLQNAIVTSEDSLMQRNYRELSRLRTLTLKLKNTSNDRIILDSARIMADSLDQLIISQLGEYAALKRRFEIHWTDVQANLKSDEVAIEFSRYKWNDTAYAYVAQVVRPSYKYPYIVKLCAEKELTSALTRRGGYELYKLVWKPLDSLLQNVKTVYYSPDGQLHSVPFHALCVNDSGGCTYLMDEYTLHRLSTTRYLADSSLINTKPLNSTIALYGGIRYDIAPDTLPQKQEESNEDFLLANTLKREMTRGAAAYLPGSKAEVETIAPMLNKLQWTTSITTGKNASENNFKALSDTASPCIIHIATHGFAFPEKEEKKKSRTDMMSLGNEQNRYSAADDPMLRCGLMFAGANRSWTGQQMEMIAKTGEDGILTAAEIANMDLSNTKLVVLSACETGLGKIEGSEGVFGLQRGFKLAGVEQLIVSLWQVPDKETNTLMTRFYADLAITKDPVKSFATAQREMRERYPDNPELWAGFVLVR